MGFYEILFLGSVGINALQMVVIGLYAGRLGATKEFKDLVDKLDGEDDQ